MAALSFHEAPQAASLATPGALSSRPGRARTERKELDWTALIVPRSAGCRLYTHWGDMWAESDSCSLDWWTVDRGRGCPVGPPGGRVALRCVAFCGSGTGGGGWCPTVPCPSADCDPG